MNSLVVFSNEAIEDLTLASSYPSFISETVFNYVTAAYEGTLHLFPYDDDYYNHPLKRSVEWPYFKSIAICIPFSDYRDTILGGLRCIYRVFTKSNNFKGISAWFDVDSFYLGLQSEVKERKLQSYKEADLIYYIGILCRDVHYGAQLETIEDFHKNGKIYDFTEISRRGEVGKEFQNRKENYPHLLTF